FLALVGERPLVLLGEATHGTAEFYRERARLTRLLVEQRGFVAVAVEADWPDAERVHAYLRGAGAADDAEDALAAFARRFPTWMWRNTEVLSFVRSLRAQNDAWHGRREPVGFYGLDLYS